MGPQKTASKVDAILSKARRVSAPAFMVDKATEDVKSIRPSTVRRKFEKVLSDLTKASSVGGQDLRLPITGGMKFPTDDSKGFARKNLEEAQGKAEVGPAPLMAKLKPKGPTIQDIAPKPSTSTAGSLPKIGHAMQNDPLIQYLRKQAMKVEDNHDAVPQLQSESPEDPGDGQDPMPSTEQERLGVNPHQEYLRKMFSTRKGFQQKYEQKEHPATAGQVDKILKR